jgi:exopolysaccharide production protein ExoZ
VPSISARIDALDALRGLLAIGVMAYHLLAWTDTARLLTLGTYGVYAFFVLSGFALEWVYSRRLRDHHGTRRYGAARVARIFPLYATVALVTALVAVVGGRAIDVRDLLLNVTLLFGFFDPGATSTVVGGWSIGIEVVFYVLFPIIAWLRLSTRWLAVLALAALVLRMVYVEAVLGSGPAFGDAWVAYSQMPSFLWFFLAGMVGARLVAARDARHPMGPASRRLSAAWPFIGALGILAVVVACSAAGDTRAMFAGPLGLGLSLAVAGAVVLAAHALPWRGAAARVAAFLGDISYGTYLLHPIVWTVLLRADVRARDAALMTLVAAPLLAFVVHRALERPVGAAIRSALAPKPALARPIVGDERLETPTSSV